MTDVNERYDGELTLCDPGCGCPCCDVSGYDAEIGNLAQRWGRGLLSNEELGRKLRELAG